MRIRLQGFASQFLAGSEFPSAGHSPACGFYSGNQRFPEPLLAMQVGLSTVSYRDANAASLHIFHAYSGGLHILQGPSIP